MRIVWSDTVLSTNGMEYILEVCNDWMAGHGLFVDNDGQPNRFRWAVYLNSPERPRMAYKYGMGSLDSAIREGTEKLRTFRE